MTEQWRVW